MYKMNIESLKIKTKTSYDWDDIIYIYDFDSNLLKIIKRGSKIGINIYYVGHILESNYYYNTIKPVYIFINRLFGFIEKIEGSSDRYLVVTTSINNNKIIKTFDTIWKYIERKIISNEKHDIDNEIEDYDKLRFNSDIDLPTDKIIEFCSLVINVGFVIEKDHKYYPEIYLDECLHVQNY